LNILFDRE